LFGIDIMNGFCAANLERSEIRQLTCVRICLIYGSETWPVRVEHELKLNRTELSMIKWMCKVKLNE